MITDKNNKNKAKRVREALGMTPTEAGRVLLGYSSKQAYDTWSQWESGKKKPSKPTQALFDVILILDHAKRAKIPGAERALEYVLTNSTH